MAVFTNFSPTIDQTGVARTAVVSFTILDDAYGTNINTLNVSIAGKQVLANGTFVNQYLGKIFSITGKHVIGIYPKIPFFAKAAQISVHIDVRDSLGTLVSTNYSFYTIGYNVVTDNTTPTITRPCEIPAPFFPPTDLGLVIAIDSGTGTEVELQWKDAAPSNENNVVFYNLYYSTNRSTIFDGYPEFIVSDTEASIGGIAPGDTHYFAVRATEFDPLVFTITGFKQAGPNMYFYPLSLLDGNIAPTDMFIPSNVDHFPNFGIILIGTELIKYNSLQTSPSGFVVATSGRGYFGTVAEAHQSGTAIRVYKGFEDTNTVIVQATPTFQKPNYALTWIKSDGYGPDGYRDGYDGYDAYYNAAMGSGRLFDGYDGYYIYKTQRFDSITTDGTNNDASGTFSRFDYCGTWRTMSPQSFMQGQCTPSYFGGVQVKVDADGYRHLVKIPNARTHMLQREELLLETTGEPMVLLRRMWTGTRCLCYMNRREHPDARCPVCFNTGFVQGYIQFFNPRTPDRRIIVRVDPAVDDLNIVDRGGLEPAYEPSGWTLPFPAIKDRDVIIRFNPNNTEEFRYEILDVTRSRALFEQTGAQKFRMKRLPKTSLIYQFPIVRDTRPIPGAIVTTTNSGPGLNPHSHQLIIREGDDLYKIRTATLVAENHNHIVINGMVQNVMGHTHTLLG